MLYGVSIILYLVVIYKILKEEGIMEIKYYEVSAKCGHVRRSKYIVISFGIKAYSKSEAAKKCRQLPRVKHDHKDAILDIIKEKYGFEDISHHLYHRTRDFPAAQYVELLGTYSDHIAIEENTRRKFFAEIEAAINRMGGVITIFDTIDLQLARKPERA